MREVLLHCIKIFSETCDVCDQVPVHTDDPVRFFSFLSFLMIRIRALRESDTIVLPTSMVVDETTGEEHGIILVVTKTRGNTDANFSVAVINTSSGRHSGLDYHASCIEPSDGSVLRNMAFELNNIPNEKIENSAFWFVVFKAAVTPNAKYDAHFFYDKTLPFLTAMPILSSLQVSIRFFDV